MAGETRSSRSRPEGSPPDPGLVAAVRLIGEAIDRMRVLSFTYKGEERTAAPYIVGRHHTGRMALSAVQRSGGSGNAFRTFYLEGLSDLRITDQKFFGDDPGYNAGDAEFPEILRQVKAADPRRTSRLPLKSPRPGA